MAMLGMDGANGGMEGMDMLRQMLDRMGGEGGDDAGGLPPPTLDDLKIFDDAWEMDITPELAVASTVSFGRFKGVYHRPGAKVKASSISLGRYGGDRGAPRRKGFNSFWESDWSDLLVRYTKGCCDAAATDPAAAATGAGSAGGAGTGTKTGVPQSTGLPVPGGNAIFRFLQESFGVAAIWELPLRTINAAVRVVAGDSTAVRIPQRVTSQIKHAVAEMMTREVLPIGPMALAALARAAATIASLPLGQVDDSRAALAIKLRNFMRGATGGGSGRMVRSR